MPERSERVTERDLLEARKILIDIIENGIVDLAEWKEWREDVCTPSDGWNVYAVSFRPRKVPESMTWFDYVGWSSFPSEKKDYITMSSKPLYPRGW